MRRADRLLAFFPSTRLHLMAPKPKKAPAKKGTAKGTHPPLSLPSPPSFSLGSAPPLLSNALNAMRRRR